jgi:hypothetical protein
MYSSGLYELMSVSKSLKGDKGNVTVVLNATMTRSIPFCRTGYTSFPRTPLDLESKTDLQVVKCDKSGTF